MIRYTEREFAPELREWTRGRGADVVYDSVGRSTFEGSLASLRPRGLLVLFGQSSGPVPPFDLGRLNAMGSLFVTRPVARALHGRSRRARAARGRRASTRSPRAGSHVRIGAEFPLARAADAHRALEGRATTGKVLLRP